MHVETTDICFQSAKSESKCNIEPDENDTSNIIQEILTHALGLKLKDLTKRSKLKV